MKHDVFRQNAEFFSGMKLISFNQARRLLITSPAKLNNRSDGTLVHYTDK